PSSLDAQRSALPPLWLEGQCVSLGRPVSYAPFQDILRAYFQVSPDENRAEIARKVMEGVKFLFPRGAEAILPILGHMLSFRFGNELDERLAALAPEQLRHQTLLRLQQFFQALARRQPLILVLEDLHWADDLSLELI